MSTLAANGIRIGDRYTLLGKLGEGGEGEVWRARDHLQSREVALKVLRPEVARLPGKWEALVREHEISTRLAHPHILRIEPPVREAGSIALPMELAPGGDLRRLCGVSYLEIVPVLIEVAQALAYAHERGVVHGDLKPGNVLFDARGHARLADFGAARAGLSPFTASPQQLRGEAPTPSDDIYGLGALAYELLSGHPPYYPRFDLRRSLEEPVPPLKPAHLAPGRLIALVMAMLAKQPRQRPASIREVLETLDAALNDTLAFAYDETPDALAATSDMLPQLRIPEDELGHPVLPQSASSGSESPLAGRPGAPPVAPSSTADAASSLGAPLRAVRGSPETELRAIWGDIRVEGTPNLMKLEPLRGSRWPWGFAAGIAAVAVAMFVLLHGSARGRAWTPASLSPWRALAPPAVVQAVRGAVEAPLRAMENRNGQAARSGSPRTSTPETGSPSAGATPGQGPSQSAPDQPPTSASEPPARAPAAEAGAATGHVPSAPTREASAPTAPEAAGVNGSQASAPSVPGSGSPRAARGRAGGAPYASRSAVIRGRLRDRAVPGVQSLLDDARAAESGRDFSRAAQDYSQALALDPANAAAHAGLGRANAAFGAGEYSQAVGAGFAALGAGRLEEARADFQRARSIEPRGREAAQGLRQVAAALRVRDAAESRFRERADLENRLQALVDDPQRLGSASVRAEAARLIREANAMSSSGPVLRSLAARLTILLPAYDRPVHLALVSDNLTEVQIPQIGSFGTFARREIDLKPGKYTVIGTRAGYREVRRDVIVAPGEDAQTISVRCEQPI